MDTDVCPAWLAPFVTGPSAPLSALPAIASASAPATVLFDGPGIVGGSVRRVVCRRARGRFTICVEGTSPVQVGEKGETITSLAPGDAGPGPLEQEVLFGPALVLALALRGVFCLHASAVRSGSDALAFLGPSSAGKSTLASEVGLPGWARLADDIVPVTVSPAGVFALPRFPQLKLPPDEQYGVHEPEGVRLARIYEISAPSASASTEDGAEAVAIRPLAPRDGMLSLLKHIVASRLFDRPLVERQLAFCEEVARRIPVSELRYPRKLEALPLVRSAVAVEAVSSRAAAPRPRQST